MSNERMWEELKESCNYNLKEVEETLKYLKERLEIEKEESERQMNKLEEVKELVTLFKNTDNEVLFMALLLNEKIDYQEEIEDIIQLDIDYLSEKYEEFINSKHIYGLLNGDVLDLVEGVE